MNASEQTFSDLHYRIISGQYQLGYYLNPRDLCNELKVSLVPVREALIRLSEQHLLDWDRNRGFKISHLEIRDVISIYEQLQSIYCNGIRNLSRINSRRDMPLMSREAISGRKELENYIEIISQEILSPREKESASILRNQIWYVRSILQGDEKIMTRIASDLMDIYTAIQDDEFENASIICARSFQMKNQDVIDMMSINGISC